jgi:hypothetical protein
MILMEAEAAAVIDASSDLAMRAKNQASTLPRLRAKVTNITLHSFQLTPYTHCYYMILVARIYIFKLGYQPD